ncbi:GntR family transcriptional regulator [Anaerococcus sp. AGMB00486]|uniref:GntR family transcriptional regulator n=1 Tax=Anaerococcus faecalis TaxID=2742993 RepID=A0ABX2NBX9_9FIRM|nr:GntR family transcriptional regulator [Anaerococcus faecalis]NVF12199.1 GntR family transcriptional regulator [Anaerococcus faecalis]
MEFDNDRPIYIQILEDFKGKISSGKWKAGEKIDSVRNLAKEYEVNPNTVQRALQELERDGLCHSQRTAGRFVTEDEKLIKSLSKNAFEIICDDFITSAKSLKIAKDDALEGIKNMWED